MTTLTDLLSPRSRDVIEATLLSSLQGQGFPVTDYNEGSVPLTLLRMFATGLLDREPLAGYIAAAGFLDLAAAIKDPNGNAIESWCELLAEQSFGVTRDEATFSRKRFALTCTSGPGPYTRAAGEMRAVSSLGNYYVNTESITIPDGGSVEAVFQAESPGPIQDKTGTIDLVTPLPGVALVDKLSYFSSPTRSWTGTGSLAASASAMPSPVRRLKISVTKTGRIGSAEYTLTTYVGATMATVGPYVLNGAIHEGDATITPTDGTSGTASFVAGDWWMVGTPGESTIVIGSPKETLTSLVQRCRDRWPMLSAIATESKFAGWVRQCSSEQALGVTRVSTEASTEIALTTNVYVAGYTGTVAAETLAILQSYIDARTPTVEKGLVMAADTVAINVTGGVQVKRGKLAAVKAASKLAWNDYLASVPIGGDMPGHRVRITKLAELIMDCGAYTYGGLQINGAALDLTLAADEVPAASESGTDALTWIEVV